MNWTWRYMKKIGYGDYNIVTGFVYSAAICHTYFSMFIETVS